MKRKLWFLLPSFCLFCGFITAQDSKDAEQTNQQQTQEDKERNPGQWWLENSLEIQPLPEDWLFHNQGSFSFSHSSGNVTGFDLTGGALSVLRKGLYTNRFSYFLNFQDVKQKGGGSFTQEVQDITDIVSYSLNPQWEIIGGVHWEVDQPKLVSTRFGVFGGASVNTIHDQRHKLQAIAALGWEDESFEVAGFDENNPLLYLHNNYDWVISSNASFSQGFKTYFDLKRREDVRVNLDLSLNFHITSHIGIGPSFQWRFDNRPVTQREKNDLLQMITIQFIQ